MFLSFFAGFVVAAGISLRRRGGPNKKSIIIAVNLGQNRQQSRSASMSELTTVGVSVSASAPTTATAQTSAPAAAPALTLDRQRSMTAHDLPFPKSATAAASFASPHGDLTASARSASAIDFGSLHARTQAHAHTHTHALAHTHGRAQAPRDPSVYRRKFRAVAEIPIILRRLRSFNKADTERDTERSADQGTGWETQPAGQRDKDRDDDGVRALGATNKKMSSTRIYAPQKNTKVFFKKRETTRTHTHTHTA